jgi:spermidine synthase
MDDKRLIEVERAAPLASESRAKTHEQQSLPAFNGRLPYLLLLFVGSGCAALIYEVVWFQLLELVIGSAAVSLGVLLGTFMGGMCIGSLALSRIISPRRHPLRVYAFIELGIGVCGIAILLALPYLDRFYVTFVGHGWSAILWRGVVCAICLLPPTVLMGATLPAISRWVETTPRGVSWLGFFYGGNTAGAVLGCLLAGFYLLRVHDMTVATYVAAAINGSVAAIGLLLAASTKRYPIADCGLRIADSGSRANPKSIAVYLTIALSGMSALGAEVVWTRLLSLLLGATVYTFSIILAVFLIGLGIGSSIGAIVSRGVRSQAALGVCQAILAGAIAWAAYCITQSLPHWPIDPSLLFNPWMGFQLDLVRCAWAVLPASLMWGASFPLALAAAVVPGRDPGRAVGRVYAANTVGAIVGAVLLSIVVIPQFGTQQAQRLLIGLAILATVIALVPLLWSKNCGLMIADCGFESAGSNPKSAIRNPKSTARLAWAFVLVLIVAAAVPLGWSVSKVSWEMVAYGRNTATSNQTTTKLYMGEGMNSSVAVTELNTGVRNFHVSGKIEASTEPQDMRLQRMLGHLSALLHPNPRSVLVVGCGAGVTAGTFVKYPQVERIVICEIEPLIPEVVAEYFKDQNYGVVDDHRVEIVYDDARHYVLTTKEKFDIITSDPIHPWVKGAATLYSKEYFEMCKQRLNPGGVITQWVPLYESTPNVVKSEFATFFDVFPYGTIWSNDYNGSGYDVVVLARTEPMEIDVDKLEARLNRADYLPVSESLGNVGFFTATDLLATYAGLAEDLKPWLIGAQINRDRNLRLQYIAGLGLNLYQEGMIYNQIVSYRKFPDRLFAGTDKTLQALKEAIFKRR